jgi:hypothetical protein
MEFEAPAADILGFEHTAKTRREKAAVEKAKTQLSAPLALFALPASAACQVAEAVVEIDAAGPGHEAKSGKTAKPGKADNDHSEVRAQYALECASPANITGIEFGYFRSFAGAQKLDINVITSKGQSKFEVTRTRPSLSLTGMM